MNYKNIYQLAFGNNHDLYKQNMLLHTEYKNRNKEKQERSASFRNVTPDYRLRNALYYEAYKAMNNIEKGVAKKLEFIYTNEGRKLEIKELDEIISNLERDPEFIPFIQEARTKMATVKSLDADPGLYKSILKERFEAHNRAINNNNSDEFAIANLEKLKDKLSMPDALAVFQRLGDRNNER